MRKRKVPRSTRVLKSAEVANPPSKQTAQIEDVPADRGNGRRTDQIMTAARRQWRQLDWSLVWMIMAVKAVIFVFGVQSYLTLMNVPIDKWYGWLEIWNRWDSLRHIRLAQIGYAF